MGGEKDGRESRKMESCKWCILGWEKKIRMKTFVRMSERKVAKETRANACECRALKLSEIMNERGAAQMKKGI